ncbi:MAG: polyphenol oxidase family protein, partial [Deferribacterales bacterium]
MYIKPSSLEGRFLSLTTSRYSGCSTLPYNTLNLGYFTDDLLCHKNYDLIKEIFKLKKIIISKQIHSSKIINIKTYSYQLEEGDGFFTNLPDIFTGIQTADCFNVQVVGENYLANLHCGWRSIFLGIIENALELFYKVNDTVLKVVIGPGICEYCYEVGGELIESF